MNLSTSSVGATGAAPSSRAATDPAGQEDATPDPRESFGLLVGLLTQASAPVGSEAVAVTTIPNPKQDHATTDESALDWTLPFVAPTVPATPLDLEPPDPNAGAGVTPASDASTPAAGSSLTAVIESIRAMEPGAREAPNEPASVALPAPVGPAAARVEAGPQGASHVVVTRTVHVPVGDSRWPGHVGQEVRLLVERGVQAATLRVSPEHLGPVEVRIDIVSDKAHVLFGAAHADTRAALGEAIPRLREMFAEQGLALGDAGVRRDFAGGFGSSPERPVHSGIATDEGEEPSSATIVLAVRSGLVDAYA